MPPTVCVLEYNLTPSSGKSGSNVGSSSLGVPVNSNTSLILTTPVPGAAINKSALLSVVEISLS